MTREEFERMYRAHKKWLATCNSAFFDGERMRVQYEVIVGDFREYDFTKAVNDRCIFRSVRFFRCKFKSWQAVHCSFFGCIFEECTFDDASFSGSILYCCDFRDCILEQCSFTESSIACTDFRHNSALKNCSFIKANITSSSLEHAKFVDNVLFETANIQNTYLPESHRMITGRTLVCPIVGYKKTMEGVVIKVEIPAGAIVFSINGKKCRTNRAKIIDMKDWKVLHSSYDITFQYTLGQEIEILDFDPCYSHECAPGFHFFMTEQEAEDYSV